MTKLRRLVGSTRVIRGKPAPPRLGDDPRRRGAFALITLLGFDYRPQLADLPDAKLWRIAIGADYGPLNAAARGKIDLARIERQWPDILRVVASIHTGAVPAYDILRVLALGGMPTQLGDALAHYGRIFKTLYVLSYVDDEPYRREIKGMRYLQEGRHDLARTAFHGRKGELRHGYRDGMEDQLGALGLVLNTITLWNTVYRPRHQRAARGRLRRPRCRSRAPLAVHAPAHQLPRPLLLRPS